ncbi:MAG: Fungalysin metallopeptidase-domain-containing protein [Piptocephalis tieghemiana]|nr:MAG: Fungalysin metallopeptidase-domain-containing protein [Piptocephalis tieghemiana]
MPPLYILSLCLMITISLVSADRIASFGPNLQDRTYSIAPNLSPPDLLVTTQGSTSLNDTLPPDLPSSRVTEALRFIQTTLYVPPTSLRLTDHLRSHHTNITHLHFRQVLDGLDIINANVNVNIGDNLTVLSYGSSLHTPSRPISPGGTEGNTSVQTIHTHIHPSHRWSSPSSSTSTPIMAVQALGQHLHRPLNASQLQERSMSASSSGHPQATSKDHVISGVPYALEPTVVRQAYLRTSSDQVVPVWQVILRTKEDWINAHLDRSQLHVLSLSNWVSDAQYRIIPLNSQDPFSSPGSLIHDPADLEASPLGWHQPGKTKKPRTDTIGNNVFSQEDWDGKGDVTGWEEKVRPDPGSSLSFDYPLPPPSTKPKDYIDASITNLFYWTNRMHDFLYKYGFTEEFGAFQEDNFGRFSDAKANDAVVAYAQDGGGSDNANFASPPDGQKGVLRVYLFHGGLSGWRDAALEVDIVIHEYTHGLSTRLTGGGSNADCLAWGEAAGMGEGWSDFIPILLQVTPESSPSQEVFMGVWVMGGGSSIQVGEGGGADSRPRRGIRKYPYSTLFSSNPTTYGYLNDPSWYGEVHSTGEIWCNILWEMAWALMGQGSHSSNLFDGPNLSSGNALALQLVIDGMKLQPCQPTFISARDAILQAEMSLKQGKHSCALWSAFSKRGLGPKASSNGPGKVIEDFSLPSACAPTIAQSKLRKRDDTHKSSWGRGWGLSGWRWPWQSRRLGLLG